MYRVGDIIPADFDFQFQEPAPAQAPTPAPEPAPVQGNSEPAISSAQPQAPAQDQPAPTPQFKVGDTIPADFDFQFQDEAPAPAEGERPGFGSSFATGVRSGLGGTPDSFAGVADLVQDVGGGAAADSNVVSDYLRGIQQWVSGGDQTMKSQGMGDLVTSWDAAKNYLGETIGQGVGSTMGYLGATGAGAVIGGVGSAEAGAVTGPGEVVAAPTGAVTGALVGGLGYNIATNWGQMRNGLAQEDGIKQMLADGRMNRQQLIMPSLIGGTIMGGLEQIGDEALLGSLGLAGPEGHALLDAMKKQAVKTIAGMTARGAFTESGTEGMQQATQEITSVVSGGDVNLQQRLMSVLQNAVGGVIAGSAMHLAGGLKQAAGVKLRQAATQAAPAGEEAPPATPDAAGGQPTPSQLGGAATPPQPAEAGPATSAASAVNPGKVTEPIITPAEAPVDPAVSTTLNPQPTQTVNPKVTPTPSPYTGEDYRKETDPDFIEPESDDDLEPEQEPVDINFDEPTVNVAGAALPTPRRRSTARRQRSRRRKRTPSPRVSTRSSRRSSRQRHNPSQLHPRSSAPSHPRSSRTRRGWRAPPPTSSTMPRPTPPSQPRAGSAIIRSSTTPSSARSTTCRTPRHER